MASGSRDVQGDLQATRQLLAQAVEWLDHMNRSASTETAQVEGSAATGPQRPSGDQDPRQQQNGRQQQGGQSGRAYPYNPIPGPTQERLSLFQPSSGFRSFQARTLCSYSGGYNRRLPAARSAPKSKKKKVAVWQHAFVCLADVDQTRVPTPLEKAKLMQAGLGPKDIAFLEQDGGTEFHQDLLDAFPKLKKAGGYELLRTSERSNKEVVIPSPPGGYTAVYCGFQFTLNTVQLPSDCCSNLIQLAFFSSPFNC